MLVEQDARFKMKTVLLKKLKRGVAAGFLAVFILPAVADAHIIPPEKFHPVAESYRRMTFVLNLNPVPWEQVGKDVEVIAGHFASLAPSHGAAFGSASHALIAEVMKPYGQGTYPAPGLRKETARKIFEMSTHAVARTLVIHLDKAEDVLGDYSDAFQHVTQARQIWRSFEYEVEHTDNRAFPALGRHWLTLTSELGSPGILAVGYLAANTKPFGRAAGEIRAYVSDNFGDSFEASGSGRYAPLPEASPTFDPEANVPPKLPPGNNINKQVPRPRQILNMAARGVDESETPLIALGDMAFDSAFIFGEPARSLQMTCNTCHNKGVTNPQFVIPGLSSSPGGVDVSSNYFAPHANNGHWDPVDIPDLRGIRFSAPYGRNGRFPSLREFIRNGVMHEFNGVEPDPLVLDAMVAYMNEFDFLPNPYLKPDGSLSDKASDAAVRGEKIFNKPFDQMSGKSCATCHVASDHFLDHKRHDIGTVGGAEPYARDGALDTPTLLSARFTGPYFHDGSQPTLRSVNEWFNNEYDLALTADEIADLTAYVETVGDGVDSYEDTPYYLDAEMEEFSFFLSTYEFLKGQNKRDVMNITFLTIAGELRNHKWELQDDQYLHVMDRLAEIMDEARLANLSGKTHEVDELVAQYRALYDENVDNLK